MPFRDAARTIKLGLLACALCGLVLQANTGAYTTYARAEAQNTTRLEDIKTSLDSIEQAVSRDDTTGEELADLRQKLNGATDALHTLIDDIEPRAHEAEERLKQLGPTPGKDAPPERAEVANERQELTRSFGDLDGRLKEARVLSVRADQLSERLAQRRHAVYARELLARSPSVLDPRFWSEASHALPIVAARASAMLDYWQEERADAARLGAAAVLLLGIAAIAIIAGRWWIPRLSAPPSPNNSDKAWTALWVFISVAARMPLASLTALLALEALGLLTTRLEQIAQGLVAGIATACFGHAVARALFAVDMPQRRLVAEDENIARCFHSHLVWGSRVLGCVIPLQIVNKTLFAPLVLTVATNALFAAVMAGLLASLVARLGRLKNIQGGGLVAATWIHPLALLASVVIAAALVAGYSGLAAFIALRVIVAANAFGALYLLSTVTHTLFAAIGEDTAKGRRLAASLGVSARTLGISGALLSAVIRVLLIALAFLLIIGPWEVSTADLFDTIRNVPFGFKIGELHLSLEAILMAVFALALVLIVTRVIQRWLETELLPRTTIEPSLQLSIVTMFGYIGAIAAVALALAGLGVDLQKIALIAGALSVGIGFGLQSIVSNFVSGLILLTERPIRVGDAIVVKGEEGWVRRVRVRATEIETYDRARVIIPNSELITGVVKNWTRANRWGRLVIKVAVAYDSDPAQVRDILTDIARTHAHVVQSPAPAAFLLGFGDSALEFELRCIVADIDNALSVRSDIHYAILERFRAAGIEIPYPQRELRWREEPIAQIASGLAAPPKRWPRLAGDDTSS